MEKKKEAVKKVIAAMTVGKDVSMLFTDVLNCIQTGNIELKKLVYLYLINYAKSQPDLAILAVNTFVKARAAPAAASLAPCTSLPRCLPQPPPPALALVRFPTLPATAPNALAEEHHGSRRGATTVTPPTAMSLRDVVKRRGMLRWWFLLLWLFINRKAKIQSEDSTTLPCRYEHAVR